MERLIKNVDRKTWVDLKVEAARHGKPIGKFLEYLVDEHVKLENKKNNWDALIKRGKSLTAKEAKAVKNAAGLFEKVYGFEE